MSFFDKILELLEKLFGMLAGKIQNTEKINTVKDEPEPVVEEIKDPKPIV